MRRLNRLSLLAYQQAAKRRPQWSNHRRSIATHPYSHHATALSVLPTSVDTSAADYKENARHFGDAMARLQELHGKIEIGGPQKAREKHVARGKMLPREYASKAISIDRILIDNVAVSQPLWIQAHLS